MASVPTQGPQRLSLRVASGDPLDVRRFSVSERMSSLFTISITAVCPNDSIAFDAVLGQPAELSVKHRGGERRWTGLCSELSQVKVVDASEGLSTYELTIVPALWLTTQRRNYRMFQQLSELSIVQEVLTDWEITPALMLSGTYKTRKYRVQYGESDFAFISRMLEDAGISFYFQEEAGETKLVLADAPQKNKARAAALPFRDSISDVPMDHATSLHIGQRVRPGKYTLRDHDYRLSPSYKLMSTHEQMNVPVEQRLERYHYTPGAFLFGADKGDDTPVADDKGKTRTGEQDAQAVAQRRLEAKRANAKAVHFETSAHDLAPGTVLRFADHPHADLAQEKEWLVVASELSGTHDAEWTHKVEARSAAAAYRPPLVTPKPKVSGVESATIVGPAGEEIHTDEFGRVRAHFHWDRESQMDDNSSCWIHVVQPWGGAGYGGLNLPRIGQEVIVDFLGGDPDRPVITGRVYTNLQKVPYKLPQHKTRSAWKSDTSPGSGGFNEMMFEDLQGKELVWQQAQKNQRRLVKNDEVITVGNDRQKLVKANETETTLKDRTEVTAQNRTEITDQNRTVTIGQKLSKLVGGDEVRGTKGNRQRTVDKNEDVVIGAERKEHVKAASHMQVDANRNEAIGKMLSLIVGTDNQQKVGRNHALEAGKEIHLKAGDQVVLEAGARLTIKGPGGFIDIHSGGVDIVGNLVRINSGGSAADGAGANPEKALQATPAKPEEPKKPDPDDVSKTGIAQ
jgi:type VI secretion system secreted protein VgrG